LPCCLGPVVIAAQSLPANLRVLAARRARALHKHSPPKREQGMPGARCTRGLVCKMHKGSAHEHTGSAETLRHPPRNGFTAYAVISSATNSSCHRHRRISDLARPGWARKTSADLTPATGAGTTRFCRTLKRRSSCTPLNRSRGSTRPATSIARRRSRVHHIPSRVRDDARPPLFLERDGRS
jgi:hypothetical protein